MDDVLGIFILLTLLVFKVILMRAVWRMAGEQGRSQRLFLIASAFAALLVFLALRNRDRECKVDARVKTKPAVEL